MCRLLRFFSFLNIKCYAILEYAEHDSGIHLSKKYLRIYIWLFIRLYFWLLKITNQQSLFIETA